MKIAFLRRLLLLSAESKRFELLIPFRVYTLSRRAPSTTRTTLLVAPRHSARAAKVQFPRLPSEYFLSILRCDPCHFFHGNALYFRQFRRDIFQVAALVTLAPERHRREIRRIRLQHQKLQRDLTD